MLAALGRLRVVYLKQQLAGFGGSGGFGCAPALCHNGHCHHQAKQGTLEPHLDPASLPGPCRWVCSVCDIFQAGL